MNNLKLTVFLGVACGALLHVTTAPAQTTRTWSGLGANDSWSTPDNWGGTAPSAGDALVFGVAARYTNVNDLAADTSLAGITFSPAAAIYALSGNRITLGGNVVNNSTNSHRLNVDMVLDATRTFSAASGHLHANGVLSGSGGLTVSGANILLLSGTNTYQGPTTISSGTLRLLNGSALGTTDAGTTVVGNNRLELSGVSVTGEVVTINGNGGNSNGALQVQAGSNTWAGRIILGSTDARIGVTPSSGILVVSGVIDDGPASYNVVFRCANDGGPVVVTSTNAYDGETKIVVGTLRLAGGDNRLPTNTVLRLGNGSNIGTAAFDLNGQSQTLGGVVQDGSMPWWITNSSPTASTLTINNRTTAYTYAGTLHGNINLAKTGAATLTLNTTLNPFSGQTVVREGRLAVGGPWTLQDSTFNTGDGAMGLLALGTNTVANFGGLVGTNDLVLTNNAGVVASLRIRGSQTTVYDGRIVTACDFTKTGAGSFTMKNAGSYTGKTSIINGKLIVPSEDALGVMPAGFVANQVTFDGGTLKSFSNFVFGANNRGVTLAAGGGTFEIPDYTNTFTVFKSLTGAGGLTKRGAGVVALVTSNAYDGVTRVEESVLRISDSSALGSAAGGTVVGLNCQLELGNGVSVKGESVNISGPGLTLTPTIPSAPQVNRGALQAGTNATAEWAGPVVLGSSDSRVGAQDGGHLIISGVITGPVTNALRTSSNPNDRSRGTLLKGANTYAGSTEITRGTLFLGAANTLPAATLLDLHWSGANNQEYAALDLNGFDQTLGGLKNTGASGSAAVVTNSSATAVTLTVNQALTTDFGGVLAGRFALTKSGSGTLTLANRNGYSGATTVSGGTLKISVNNALPTNTVLALAGGRFDVGGKTNAVASLSVSANSTLELGAGSLTVTGQSSDAWAGSLTLTGTLGPASLQFLPTLSAAQLACLRYEGKRVALDASGYVHAVYGTLFRVH